MELKLRCCCGATYEAKCRETLVDVSGSFKQLADEWQNRHAQCKPPQVGTMTLPMIQPGPVTCSNPLRTYPFAIT